MDAMTTRTDYHMETAREFLTKARAYLADDDLLQASEKGWGAAAQAVKAVAETRGWNHQGHRQLYAAIDRLVAETGRRELRARFAEAGSLHSNFYEGWLSAEAIGEHLDEVERLVDQLGALAS